MADCMFFTDVSMVHALMDAKIAGIICVGVHLAQVICTVGFCGCSMSSMLALIKSWCRLDLLVMTERSSCLCRFCSVAHVRDTISSPPGTGIHESGLYLGNSGLVMSLTLWPMPALSGLVLAPTLLSTNLVNFAHQLDNSSANS